MRFVSPAGAGIPLQGDGGLLDASLAVSALIHYIVSTCDVRTAIRRVGEE